MADMKEMDLYGFLHPEITPEKEVLVSPRFKSKDGTPMAFVIRPLTWTNAAPNEYETEKATYGYRRHASRRIRKGIRSLTV